MALRVENLKADLVERLARMAGERLAPEKAGQAERFLRRYYANVAPEDMASADPDTLYGAALALLGFARSRPPGRAKLRVYTPSLDEHGWQSEHSVVEVVNDDMPFLVDSLTALLNGLDLAVHLVVHPIIGVVRDGDGRLVQLGDPADDAPAESFMHIEIDRQGDAAAEAAIAAQVEAVLAEVRAAVEDWQPMRERVRRLIHETAAPPPGVAAADMAEIGDFLRWLHDDHFTFLGCRAIGFSGKGEAVAVTVEPTGGLGILRRPEERVFAEDRDLTNMPAEVQAFLRRPDPLLITKADRVARVHRPAHMDIIGVKRFDEDGRVVGMDLLVGLFASTAYTASPALIPVLRRKVERTIRRAGFRPASHDGKALLNILENYPRDELFQISDEALFDTALGILRLQERQRVALFVRKDEFERFISALVFVPRERYDTALRLAVQRVLERAFAGKVTAYYTQVADSPLARLHFIVKTAPGQAAAVDVAEVEAQLAAAARSWSDHLQEALVEAQGEEKGLRLFRRYGQGFPASYQERHGPRAAVVDIGRIDQALAAGGLGTALYRPVEAAENEARFKVYHADTTVPLSDVLPILEHMGFRVISEVPHQVRVEGDGAVWIHDFSMEAAGGVAVDVAALRAPFEEAFHRVVTGEAEDDGFNRLIVLAGLSWRDVVVLRAYAKYLRQAGATFGQGYLERALADHPNTTRLLVELFRARFDPDDAGRAEAEVLADVETALEAVTSAEDDRILRRFLNLVRATLRTNFFQEAAGGGPKPYLSLKLDSRAVDDLPLPRPWVEVFVYSPRLEAVHLRGGKVARGGIRWSDRREDFRTEILGLMKAQMVKNAVIIPVGAKGGFVVKRPPAAGGREALLAEGVACYKDMIRGLLDLTDNYAGAGAEVVAPPRVVRHDGDDPYLVVAADKGTATFSDIANGVAADYGFWLGDAFASGGSRGYDHKAMGITARGAWESVKRHFREIGIDVQSTDFTVVGVGDMSGDVFGNGMLCSPHIRLVGAFNHMHVFVDPEPDAAASFAERQRLFALPRSTWADYDPALLSPGGAVFRRDAKLLHLSPEIRARFGIAAETVTPDALIRALLMAPADLLWFGGIGTYVKCARESHAEVGDRANDLVRVDGRDLRCKVVGEGANLAVTQLGRVEYALAGGRLNTDAIDNSAGVDTSDHEVNIKILLDGAVAEGDLTGKRRNELLVTMTDEVASLVLRDNYLQTQAISASEARGPELLDHQERFMRMLEKSGHLNRAVEFLPDAETLVERSAAKRGLTRPEIAVLLAYGKIWLNEQILASDLPDDPLLVEDLERYFPTPLREPLRTRIARHRLRREIIATAATNSMINRVGGTFVSQIVERTGMAPADIARAYLAARDAFAMRELWQGIEALDNKVPAGVQTAMLIEANRLLDRGVTWVLRQCPRPLDIGAVRGELEPAAAALAANLDDAVPAELRDHLRARGEDYRGQGVPDELARRVASLVVLASAGDIGRIARQSGQPLDAAARLYFAVGSRFGLGWLRTAAERLGTVGSHWQKLAMGAVIDESYVHQRALTARVANGSGEAPEAAIGAWVAARQPLVDRADQLMAELKAAEGIDLAMLAVASRQFRGLAED